MAESFYINLSLRELSAFKRVSFCAEAAYTHFKRNIDFATGKSNKTYSPYRIGRILSKPALGRGYPAETVSTKKAKGAIEQLCQVGLLCFDFETFKFELPLHDKTPENTPKNTPKNTVFCDFAAVFRLLLLAFALLFVSRDVPWSHGYRFSVITVITEAIDRNIPFFSFL